MKRIEDLLKTFTPYGSSKETLFYGRKFTDNVMVTCDPNNNKFKFTYYPHPFSSTEPLVIREEKYNGEENFEGWFNESFNRFLKDMRCEAMKILKVMDGIDNIEIFQ